MITLGSQRVERTGEATCVLCFAYRSLKNWDMRAINVGFANGAELGLKVDESFKESDMVTFLRNYADHKGIGGNILTSEFLIKIFSLHCMSAHACLR